MTIISLRPSVTSLVITLINASIELACLSALYTLIARIECSRLQRGRLINIRWHCFYIRLVALLVMLMFIILEIIISLNSNTTSIRSTKIEKCFRVLPGIDNGDDSAEGEAVSFRCLSVNKKQFSYRIGNYSHQTDRIECASELVYQYEVHKREFLSMNIGERICDQGTCATVAVEGRKVLISAPFEKKFLEMKEMKNKTIEFAPTMVNFDPRNLGVHFVKNLVKTYQGDNFDEHEVRRRVLLGGKNDSCSFAGKEKQATSISTWVVIFIGCIWSVSALLFLIMVMNKRSVFYDMHNTFDWASKTYQMAEELRGKRLYLKMVTINGMNRFYVVDEYADEYDSELELVEEIERIPSEN